MLPSLRCRYNYSGKREVRVSHVKANYIESYVNINCFMNIYHAAALALHPSLNFAVVFFVHYLVKVKFPKARHGAEYQSK